MVLSRRQLINTSAATGAVVVGSLAPSAAAVAAPGTLCRCPVPVQGGGAPFGPLVEDENHLLALPEGFTYEIVAVSDETTMRGGAKTPARPDGTLVVATASGYRLVQNHEVTPGSGDTPVPLTEGTVYDPGAEGGGCTVIDVDPRGGVSVSGSVSRGRSETARAAPPRGAPG